MTETDLIIDPAGAADFEFGNSVSISGNMVVVGEWQANIGNYDLEGAAYVFVNPAIAAPTVTAISPTSGSTTGGTSVTISGTNLAGATAVDFGTVAATIQSDTAASDHRHQPSRDGDGTRDGNHCQRHLRHLDRRPVHLCRGGPDANGEGHQSDFRFHNRRHISDDQRHEPGRGHGGEFWRGRRHDPKRYGHADHRYQPGRDGDGARDGNYGRWYFRGFVGRPVHLCSGSPGDGRPL